MPIPNRTLCLFWFSASLSNLLKIIGGKGSIGGKASISNINYYHYNYYYYHYHYRTLCLFWLSASLSSSPVLRSRCSMSFSAMVSQLLNFSSSSLNLVSSPAADCACLSRESFAWVTYKQTLQCHIFYLHREINRFY